MISIPFPYIQYCFDNLLSQIPVGLLLYSHVPTAAIALIFGTYVAIQARNRAGTLLFTVCALFAVWCTFDLGSWFAFTPQLTMFTWGLLDLTAVGMFFFAFYFLYVFTTGKQLPTPYIIAGFLLILPTMLTTLLGANLPYYDANSCEAIESHLPTLYPYVVEGVFIIAVLVHTFLQYRRGNTKDDKRRTLLSGIGIFTFLLFFFSATFIVSLLAESNISTYVYNYEIYGLFGMPILLAYLGYLIVRYRAFNLKVFGAQALTAVLVVLLAAELVFVTSVVNRILVGITLLLTLFVGVILIRSVRREIEQRERIELLAKDLEKANEQQVTLIHFITHQLKGFVAKSRNIFSMLQEGDYGAIPDSIKPIIDEGFTSATKGAQTIQDILNASNIKSGNMSYEMKPFDFKALVDGIVASQKPNADAKNVALTLTEPTEPIMLTGDQMQMENAIKNIVDNTIKYTQQGSIKISLTNDGKTIRFMTEDTGVGITKEDMQRLFTEGGHGAESQKVNVESTGFGLYIVKNIIEAHKGKVWAESEGTGKGSRFIVELPADTE